MKPVRILAIIAILLLSASAAEKAVPVGLASFYNLMTVPSSPTDLYTQDVWLKDIELTPQSTTNPTCTVQDKSGVIVYPTIQLTAHFTYRDDRLTPRLMTGGITWSCSDTSVAAFIVVQH